MTIDQDPTAAMSALAERLNLLAPYAVRAAVTLGIPDHLRDWTSLEELSDRMQADPVVVGLLTDYLVGLGLVERGDTRLRLASAGSALLSDHPAGLARHWELDSASHRMEQAYRRIPEAMRAGTPAYVVEHGRDLYADVASDVGFLGDVLESARSLVNHTAKALADRLELDDRATIVDVGAGSATYLHCLLDRFPHATGVAFDLPTTLALAEEKSPESVRERVTWAPGDFFRDKLPAGDAYLLCNVVVDLDDVRAAALLANLAASASRGARLIMVELARDAAEPTFASHLSLHQFCMTGGP